MLSTKILFLTLHTNRFRSINIILTHIQGSHEEPNYRHLRYYDNYEVAQIKTSEFLRLLIVGT